MFTHEASICVGVPPGTGFGFLADPRNQVKITPGLVAVSATPPEDGFATRYQYELAGVTLSGQLTDSLRRPPTRLVRSLSGALDGTVRYRLTATGNGTRITCAMAIRVPRAVLNAVPTAVVETRVEQEVTATLSTLQSYLEH
ncbi:SRPBCC family protein [Halorhabdus sp. CUG00001]|uniref:SRPBCC family protein n=1 Tax=Halorhabdus sp. CUG00001 TaxID=2600297 RepID=UPI002102277A|nr:SRPBCC family protein [Halorhabdus sp. CUG00001]